ncbi:RMD1 family protein [Paenibacillus lycopersici]|uniref:RMD1 family protein n=1 Tax=Paenibacillus lycopersici TaxID=2704462 RepID=A0A6C0FQX5_9BACL|nr:RMD1 family protein [Paenibacillus lycopersici]QHT59536.1 RMD1 family protein [Paenibacillus lycopersici]
MEAITFKAFAVANEIDLNKIAIHCGIPKKFTWEEPLVLKEDILSAILHRSAGQSLQVLVFSFGSVVFVNHTRQGEIDSMLYFLKQFEPDIELLQASLYTDDYSLHREETDTLQWTDEYVIVPEYEAFYPELIATVLAKSVALEKIEEQLGKIHDKLEYMIERFEKGRLRIGNKELAKTTAAIVRHEYNSLGSIMILDKPDITWANSSAGMFYDKMLEFFELNDRHTIMKNKTEVLYRIMEGFSTISHSNRGLFVEWIVVILIVIEVVLSLLEIAGIA